jgi:type VI secretion system protein ImpE
VSHPPAPHQSGSPSGRLADASEQIHARLREGRLEDALELTSEQVRLRPDDPKLRLLLIEIFSSMGNWERAMGQFDVLQELGPNLRLFSMAYRPVVASEMIRAEVFAGRQKPLILGEPEEWLSYLIEARRLLGEGRFDAAAELQEKALANAPARNGTINGNAFSWLADADDRFGPVFEVILEGGYYWTPISHVRRIRIEAPRQWRDHFWISVSMTLANDGEAQAFMPVRYPGTESASDSLLRLSRRTEWFPQPGGLTIGLGQRLLATDREDYPLLDIRALELSPPA